MKARTQLNLFQLGTGFVDVPIDNLNILDISYGQRPVDNSHVDKLVAEFKDCTLTTLLPLAAVCFTHNKTEDQALGFEKVQWYVAGGQHCYLAVRAANMSMNSVAETEPHVV